MVQGKKILFGNVSSKKAHVGKAIKGVAFLGLLEALVGSEEARYGLKG